MKTKPSFLFYLSRENSGLLFALIIALCLLGFTVMLDFFLYNAGLAKVSNLTIGTHLANVFFSFFAGFLALSFIFSVIRWKNRTNRAYVLPKTLLLFLIMAFVLGLHILILYLTGNHGSIISRDEGLLFLSYEFFPLMLFTLLLAFSVFFISYVIQFRSFDFFINSLTNKFENIREFEGFIMFLDLNDSTPLMRQLGGKRFFSFQHDFFKDLEIPLYQTKGQLVYYEGDELNIYWETNAGIKNSNCIRFISAANDAIKKKEKYYLEKHGVVPEFKAGLHYGVIDKLAEGFNRVDVITSGRAFQVCSRIIGRCHELKSQFLVSARAYEKIKDQTGLSFQSLGEFDLKGIDKKVGIYRAESQ